MRNLFADRSDAGKQLVAALPDIEPESTIVVALPRGGVPVAAEICRAFNLPLDLAIVRKIGTPGQPELALGAVVDGDEPLVVINTDLAIQQGISETEVRYLGEQLHPEIERRRKLYMGDRSAQPVAGKTVIVVDDGVATGASVRAVLRSLRKRKASPIILALPVAPSKEVTELKLEADQTVCLMTPSPFYSVGTHYADFTQVSDDEVIAIMIELS